MSAAAIPNTEAERQASLDRLAILDTPAEDRFDRITRLATKILGVPIALVSLVDRDRQWFKSVQGLDVSETSREYSFCAHAILLEGTFIVADARQDERFRDNPLVTGAPNIRFYAGQPLHAPDGNRVGTLCVIDQNVREFSPDDLQSLRDLAALVESELHVVRLSLSQSELINARDEAERKASIDVLTRAWGRAAILDILAREVSRTKRDGLSFGLVMLDLDRFKSINDTYGHQAGDAVLRAAVDHIKEAARPYDAVGRYGGEEFMIILIECDRMSAEKITERIRSRIETSPVSTSKSMINVTASQGLILFDGSQDIEPTDLVEAADRALYNAKNSGRNRVEIGTIEVHKSTT